MFCFLSFVIFGGIFVFFFLRVFGDCFLGVFLRALFFFFFLRVFFWGALGSILFFKQFSGLTLVCFTESLVCFIDCL